MEQLLDFENVTDRIEMAGDNATDAYPPKLEREETKEESDWPPKLTRLLNPFTLIGDIGEKILSELEKKGKELEAELYEETGSTTDGGETASQPSAETTSAPEKTATSDGNPNYAQDIARRDATMARYESMQNNTLDQINKTLERIDKIQEQRETNLKNQVTFDAPKYNGV